MQQDPCRDPYLSSLEATVRAPNGVSLVRLSPQSCIVGGPSAGLLASREEVSRVSSHTRSAGVGQEDSQNHAHGGGRSSAERLAVAKPAETAGAQQEHPQAGAA